MRRGEVVEKQKPQTPKADAKGNARGEQAEEE